MSHSCRNSRHLTGSVVSRWRWTLAALLVLVSGASALAGAVEDCEQSVDHDRAIRGCSAIISGKQKGKVAQAYYNRGVSWSDKGDNDRAIADFDQAIRLDPKYVNAYNNRGNAWSNKGDNDRAIADFDQAIRLDPKLANAYNNRGNAWSNKGDKDRAIADYDQAIRLDPNYATAYSNRGSEWSAKGDKDRAMADYDQAIRLDPKNAAAYRNRGVAWFDKGDTDRAIADYDQAIRLDPKHPNAYTARGRFHFARADFVAASEDFMRGADLGNDYAMLWRFFTRARLKQDGAVELGINSAALNSRAWPFPIIGFYLGKLPLEKLRAAADTPDKTCEMNFYLAEWHLGRGENAAAEPLLKVAVADCPKNFIEYHGALVELKRSGR